MFYEAEVISCEDKFNLDRVCIFIPSLDSEENKNNTELLRWSYILQPTEYGTLENLSKYTRPQVGSKVIVTFIENDFHRPLIIGRIDNKKVDENQSYKDTIIKDPNGNTIEVKENSINITLVSDVNLNINGNANIEVNGKTKFIGNDNADIQVNGNANIEVNGKTKFIGNDNADIQVNGNANIEVNGKTKFIGNGFVFLDAKDNVNVVVNGDIGVLGGRKISVTAGAKVGDEEKFEEERKQLEKLEVIQTKELTEKNNNIVKGYDLMSQVNIRGNSFLAIDGNNESSVRGDNIVTNYLNTTLKTKGNLNIAIGNDKDENPTPEDRGNFKIRSDRESSYISKNDITIESEEGKVNLKSKGDININSEEGGLGFEGKQDISINSIEGNINIDSPKGDITFKGINVIFACEKEIDIIKGDVSINKNSHYQFCKTNQVFPLTGAPVEVYYKTNKDKI